MTLITVLKTNIITVNQTGNTHDNQEAKALPLSALPPSARGGVSVDEYGGRPESEGGHTAV